VSRYVNNVLLDTHQVMQTESGFKSDDIGFLSHGNEKANKRINAVKSYLRTGSRVYRVDHDSKYR